MMITTARDLVTQEPDCVRSTDSVLDVARKFRDLGVSSLPICANDDQLEGTVTSNDLVYYCLADGRDPARMTAAEMVRPPLVSVDAADSAADVLLAMLRYGTRRVPVVDSGKLLGLVSQAEVVNAVPRLALGQLPGLDVTAS